MSLRYAKPTFLKLMVPWEGMSLEAPGRLVMLVEDLVDALNGPLGFLDIAVDAEDALQRIETHVEGSGE